MQWCMMGLTAAAGQFACELVPERTGSLAQTPTLLEGRTQLKVDEWSVPRYDAWPLGQNRLRPQARRVWIPVGKQHIGAFLKASQRAAASQTGSGGSNPVRMKVEK